DGSCVLSQAKNNLGRLDLPSLRYRVESAQIPTSEGPANVGRLVFIGESDRRVADILGENAGEAEDRCERHAGAGGLTDHPPGRGGRPPPASTLKPARAEGIPERTLRRARARARVRTARSGFPARAVWTLLPVEHTASPAAEQSGQSGQSGQDSERGRTGR